MCPEKLNDVLFTEGGVTTKVGGNKKACSILHAFTKYVLVVAQCRSIDWRCGARLLLEVCTMLGHSLGRVIFDNKYASSYILECAEKVFSLHTS